ncbi:astacin-like metalloendopeptidase [Toxotes jaculatrix]|uniref:astacin-like metalloendopeptidase n=1 Tax=Toxotes jaculatrix TaxID=941984 RepID=UPI001B3AF612|nr:astacin-like metalloendopeptidase [Toxotes jaculatrix]
MGAEVRSAGKSISEDQKESELLQRVKAAQRHLLPGVRIGKDLQLSLSVKLQVFNGRAPQEQMRPQLTGDSTFCDEGAELEGSVMLRLLLTALLFVGNVNSSPIRESKKEHLRDWLIMALHYMDSNPETLEELMSENSAVLEGDMILSSDRNAVEHTWPTQEIPYAISPELASRTEDFLSAMAMVSEHTCVSFHKRTTETNYLLFKTSKGCASYVGLIGGEQPVFIAPQCNVGNIIHEILHALGFHHEHTRTDREQHITILTHNIMAGMEKNFKKQQGKTFDLPYDISSIMHYGRSFFSANGLPTIIANHNVKDMGQRVKMTETDIERVRRLYNCGATKKQTEKENGDAEKEKDTNIHITSHRDQSHVSAPPASLQHLGSATGGHNNTSRGQA